MSINFKPFDPNTAASQNTALSSTPAAQADTKQLPDFLKLIAAKKDPVNSEELRMIRNWDTKNITNDEKGKLWSVVAQNLHIQPASKVSAKEQVHNHYKMLNADLLNVIGDEDFQKGLAAMDPLEANQRIQEHIKNITRGPNWPKSFGDGLRQEIVNAYHLESGSAYGINRTLSSYQATLSVILNNISNWNHFFSENFFSDRIYHCFCGSVLKDIQKIVGEQLIKNPPTISKENQKQLVMFLFGTFMFSWRGENITENLKNFSRISPPTENLSVEGAPFFDNVVANLFINDKDLKEFYLLLAKFDKLPNKNELSGLIDKRLSQIESLAKLKLTVTIMKKLIYTDKPIFESLRKQGLGPIDIHKKLFHVIQTLNDYQSYPHRDDTAVAVYYNVFEDHAFSDYYMKYDPQKMREALIEAGVDGAAIEEFIKSIPTDETLKKEITEMYEEARKAINDFQPKTTSTATATATTSAATATAESEKNKKTSH